MHDEAQSKGEEVLYFFNDSPKSFDHEIDGYEDTFNVCWVRVNGVVLFVLKGGGGGGRKR